MPGEKHESWSDVVARVELMASGSDKWDLSPNDCAALKRLLELVNVSSRLSGRAYDYAKPDVAFAAPEEIERRRKACLEAVFEVNKVFRG